MERVVKMLMERRGYKESTARVYARSIVRTFERMRNKEVHLRIKGELRRVTLKGSKRRMKQGLMQEVVTVLDVETGKETGVSVLELKEM